MLKLIYAALDYLHILPWGGSFHHKHDEIIIACVLIMSTPCPIIYSPNHSHPIGGNNCLLLYKIRFRYFIPEKIRQLLAFWDNNMALYRIMITLWR